ncbi:unnamed protein product, partial [marine sediment metagenome]
MGSLYYKTLFWVQCIIWPWIQVYLFRKKVTRWK